jgi:RimJ/RimL family protein N-acetyltransferase
VPLPMPDPPLGDDVLTLRTWTLDDVGAITRACQDPEIPRWTTVPTPYSKSDAVDWLEVVTDPDLDGQLHFAVTDAGDGSLIGSMSLWIIRQAVAEIGYWTVADARGRGHTPRALRLLSHWALDELELQRLQLGTIVGNRASERVAEKVGYTAEGVLRSWLDQRGERCDVRMWSLLPGELAEG